MQAAAAQQLTCISSRICAEDAPAESLPRFIDFGFVLVLVGSLKKQVHVVTASFSSSMLSSKSVPALRSHSKKVKPTAARTATATDDSLYSSWSSSSSWWSWSRSFGRGCGSGSEVIVGGGGVVLVQPQRRRSHTLLYSPRPGGSDMIFALSRFILLLLLVWEVPFER